MKVLPNEIINERLHNLHICEIESISGKVYDERYVAATNWESNEADIMIQNGVHDELYQ